MECPWPVDMASDAFASSTPRPPCEYAMKPPGLHGVPSLGQHKRTDHLLSGADRSCTPYTRLRLPGSSSIVVSSSVRLGGRAFRANASNLQIFFLKGRSQVGVHWHQGTDGQLLSSDRKFRPPNDTKTDDPARTPGGGRSRGRRLYRPAAALAYAKIPARLILVDATELDWQRARYREGRHLFAPADPVLVGLNTLQHWRWNWIGSPTADLARTNS